MIHVRHLTVTDCIKPKEKISEKWTEKKTNEHKSGPGTCFIYLF